MTVHPDERGRRAPTPTALAALAAVPDGYRILPDPLHGQPLTRVPARPLDVRLLLDRSHESAQAGEPTQDYLAVRCDPRRLSFAVTDGVGSSFLGDVAAQILAAHLTDWLAVSRPDRPGEPFAAALAAFLSGLSREVADQVATWPIPETVTALVRSALDQQRAYGSEAMFACGVVDLTGGREATVTVAWLGDTRIRVIGRDGQQFDHSGQTTDRWSSRLGPRGQVDARSWPVAEVARVIACTDGLLPELDAAAALPDAQLAQRLGALARRPGNDDIALVDVGLTARAMPGGEALPGSTLWRRLTEDPPARHARTTSAGSALRRFMRAVGPGAAAVPPPPAPGPASPPVPGSPPVSGSPSVAGSSVSSGSGAGRSPSSGAGPAPDAAPSPDAGPARGAGSSPVPGPRREPPVAEVSTVEELVAIDPPAGVRWRRSDRGQELTWSAVAGADAYAVQMSPDPGFAEPLLYTVHGLSFALPRLPGPSFVRLRCLVAGQAGPWGDPHDLSVPAPGEHRAPTAGDL